MEWVIHIPIVRYVHLKQIALKINIMHLETSKCIHVVEGVVLGSMLNLVTPSFENPMDWKTKKWSSLAHFKPTPCLPILTLILTAMKVSIPTLLCCVVLSQSYYEHFHIRKQFWPWSIELRFVSFIYQSQKIKIIVSSFKKQYKGSNWRFSCPSNEHKPWHF